MQTKTYNVYTFEELSDKGKGKALENLRDINTDYDWHHWAISDFVETKLQPIGFDTGTSGVYFSGFWSQGDGASFDGKLNVQKYIEYYKLQEKYPLVYQASLQGYVWGNIYKNSYGNHYSHARTRYIEIEQESENAIISDIFNGNEDVNKKFELEANDFEKDVETTRMELSKDLYSILEKEYEYLSSAEAIIETIQVNDYQFTSDGKID